MKERQRGIVVYVEGKHVKTVPKRYEDFVKDTSFITDLDHKRLSKVERLQLENRRWISQFTWDNRYTKERINNGIIVKVFKVYDRFGDVRYQAEYDNGVTAYIPRTMYNLAPIDMRYRKNSL
jgi:hypothetical protein